MSADDDTEKQIQSVLHSYLQALDAGAARPQDEILREHPELADELRAFFSDQEKLNQLADSLRTQGPRRSLSEPPTLDSAAPPPGSGQLFTVRYFGDYELLEEIARGGMGVVYRAKQVSLNRLVALKMILAGQLASASDVQRFHTEAEAAANLDYANIVPIYEVGEHDGQCYFSMKLIEGGSLAQAVPRLVDDPRETVRLLVMIARAVHHAHQRGILHRDLKPGNILLDAHGQPHVTDFGLAKRVEGDSELTGSGAIVGTPNYMPPEQALGHKVISTAADVYSLGAILYELLTGQPPFRKDSPMETLMQVIEREPVRPQVIQPKVDRDLETICLKCLEKEPQKRYDSAAALAEELERWLRGEPINARPVGNAERAWRWCGRNPVVAGLTAAVAASLLAGAVISAHFGIQAGNRAQDALRERDRADVKATEAAKEKDRADEKAVEAEASADQAKNERLRADRRSYLSDMRLAQRAWEDAQIGDLMKLLDGQRPERTGNVDLRGFEWYYWQRLCQADLLTFKEHAGPVLGVAFSRDGKRLASASRDGTVKVWEATNGKVAFNLKGHEGGVMRVAFSPDGNRLASAGEDKTIKLWDAGNGTQIVTLKGHTQTVHGVAFSGDGQRLASASVDRTVKIWDLKLGKETFTFKGHSGPLLSVAFSPDGKQIASCGGIQDTRGTAMDKSVKVWDAATGKVTHTFTYSQYPFLSAVFSPDGRQLAAAGYEQVKVYDLDTGKEFCSLVGHKGYVAGLAFDRDGKRLASAGLDQTIRVWDPANGQELLILKGHSDRVTTVAFSPNGNHLASASEDRTVKIWDLNRKQEALTFRPGSQVQGLAITPDGQQLALGTGPPSVWDLADVRKVRSLEEGGSASIALSADGQRIASPGRENTVIMIWDRANGQPIHALKGHKNRLICMAFSPDGRALASGGLDQTIKIWDLQSGKVTQDLQGHLGPVRSLAFTPDGRSLASAGDDRMVILWDIASGKQRSALRGHSGAIHSLAISRDGKSLASGSEDLSVRIWDLARAQETAVLRGHASIVYCLAFHPNGRRLVSGGQDGRTMVWDLDSGTTTLTLKSHPTCVHGVLFTPDGHRLISGSCDSTFKVWDARPLDENPVPPITPAAGAKINEKEANETFTEIRRFDLPDQVRSVAFSPDGQTVAAATGRYPGGQEPVKPGEVSLWHRVTGVMITTLKGHADGINSVAFSPDGKLLATGSNDGTAKLWDLTSGKERITLDLGQWVWMVGFSPDGSTLATAASGRGLGPHGIRIWDVATGQERISLRRNDPWSFCVALSADGTKLADWSLNGLIVWDAVSGKNLAVWRGHSSDVHALAFSPDGKLVASGCNDKTVKVWDLASTRAQATLEHSDSVGTVAFSPNGKTLASGSRGFVKLWDLADCRERPVLNVRQVLRVHAASVTGMAFSGDGKFLATASEDKTVRLLGLSVRPLAEDAPGAITK